MPHRDERQRNHRQTRVMRPFAVLHQRLQTPGQKRLSAIEIDRVNKPRRPLPSGRLTIGQAWRFTHATYLAALVLAWFVAPHGRHECFWLVAIAVVCTLIYSMPPLRTKRLGIWANVTIAIPRGVLLKVAGWSSVKTMAGIEPWYIGAIFGLFLLGATTTKDFADMEGDRRGGCRTLPIQYGVSRAAWMISPSFVIPFSPVTWSWRSRRARGENARQPRNGMSRTVARWRTAHASDPDCSEAPSATSIARLRK